MKCPSSAKTFTPDKAIKKKKVSCWTLSKNNEIGPFNKKHNFYFQIQGQLHITKRQYCQFVLKTPTGIKIERIERDDEFWRTNMEDKLHRFYFNCVLPEMIDPRHSRSMPIRNPKYVLEARKKLEESKRKKENLSTSMSILKNPGTSQS
uniref:Uncharacterized protein n=1 Tax=Graphocephala atropunctata TaxID=36148 RepID=A0A1B6L6J1_9HEMI